MTSLVRRTERQHKRQSSLPPDVAKLYSTAKWRRLRAQQLAAEPLCRACLAGKRLVPATVADHINRASDARSFWQGALQSLCATHHQAKRQAESHGKQDWRPKLGCDVNGMPFGDHPWNR